MDGEYSTQVPAAKNQVRNSTRVHVWLTFSERESVVKTCDPTECRIKVGAPILVAEIVAVLRCRIRTADFGLIVERLAEREGAQKHQSMSQTFLRFELQGVIVRIAAIDDVVKSTQERIGSPRLDIAWPRNSDLIQ